jgi:hypothetical protein
MGRYSSMDVEEDFLQGTVPSFAWTDKNHENPPSE